MFALLMIYIVTEQPAGTWIALVGTLALSFCSSGCTAAGPDAGSWR